MSICQLKAEFPMRPPDQSVCSFVPEGAWLRQVCSLVLAIVIAATMLQPANAFAASAPSTRAAKTVAAITEDAPPGRIDRFYPGDPKVLLVAGDDVLPGTQCTPSPTELCHTLWQRYANGILDVSLTPIDQGWQAAIDTAGSVTVTNTGTVDVSSSFNKRGCDAVGNVCFRVHDGNLIRYGPAVNGEEVVYAPTVPGCDSDDCANFLAVDPAGNAFFTVGPTGPEAPLYKFSVGGDLSVVTEGTGRTRKYGLPPDEFDFDNIHGLAFDSVGNLTMSRANAGTVIMITNIGDPHPPVPVAQTFGGCGDYAGVAVNPTKCLSDPVNTATGAFVRGETDVSLPGVGVALEVTRTYTSTDDSVGMFGQGWTSFVDASVTLLPADNLPARALVRTPTGQQLVFRQVGSDYNAPPGARARLTRPTSTSWALKTRNLETFVFNAAGKLTQWTDRTGQGLALAYTNGRLATITDAAGRVVTVDLNAAGDRLTQLSLADGRSVHYAYTAGHLTEVRNLDGQPTTYSYDLAGRLTEIVDARGIRVVQNTYDAGTGRVSEQLDALSNRSTFTWNAKTQTATMTDAAGGEWRDHYSGNVLKSRTDPLGNRTRYRHDRDLNLASETDPRGNTTVFTYDARGNMLSREAPSPLGYVERWQYNALDLPTEYTNGRNHTFRYTYDSRGFLVTETAPDNSVTTYERDPAGTGLPLSVTDANGAKTTFAYDTAGNLLTTTAPGNAVTSRAYDPAGRVLRITDPRGNVPGATPGSFTTEFSYDNVGHLLSVTNAKGAVTSHEYDAVGNHVAEVDALNRRTQFDYNAANELLRVIAPSGAATNYRYDARGQLVETIDAEGGITIQTYDLARRLATRTTPRGHLDGAIVEDHTWAYGHDANGNLVSVTDPLGHESRSSFDVLNRLTESTDPLGRVTTYTYDAAGNRTQVHDPLGNVTEYGYDHAGRVTEIIDARNAVTTFTYDSVGNRTSVTDALGNKATARFDAQGRMLSATDPRGNAPGADPAAFTIHYAYDIAGQHTSTTDAEGRQTSLSYTPTGQLASITDGLNHTLSYAYDDVDQLLSVTDALDHSTNYGYNADGALTSITNAKQKRWTIERDDLGRMTARQDPLGRTWTYTHDVEGNVTSTVNAAANTANDPARGTTRFQHDALGRITEVTYSDGSPGATFGYDAVGNRAKMVDYGTPQLAQSCSPPLACPLPNLAITTRYGYDLNDRLTSVTRGLNEQFLYAYDNVGNPTRRAYPDGTYRTYSYDDVGRMTAAVAPSGTVSYNYDRASNLTSTEHPNGVLETRTYDGSGLLTSITSSHAGNTIEQQTYDFDAAGNLTVIDGSRFTARYGYDPVGRLTDVCYQASGCTGQPHVSFSYDSVGNRISRTQDGLTTTYSYDDADQLLSATTPGAPVKTYGYDPNGRLIAGPRGAFTYNVADRLVRSVTSDTTRLHTYDGDGNRTSTTTTMATPALPGDVTTFQWDVNNRVPQLATEGTRDGTAITYDYGLERTAQTVDNSAPVFFLHDRLGSTTSLTTSTGAVMRQFTYEPFGEVRSDDAASPAAATTRLRFTGEYQDPDGRYYLRDRMLDPESGLFDRPDPLLPEVGVPLSSTYGYAENRPTMLVDPLGQRGEGINQYGCLGAIALGYYDPLLFGLPTTLASKAAGLFDASLDPRCTALGNYAGFIGGAFGLSYGGLSSLIRGTPPLTAKSADELADIGHAGIHHFPGTLAGKSQFFDGLDLGQLASRTKGMDGFLQKNGNTRYVLRVPGGVGVDRTTGLPTVIYTVIRKPDGSVVTMFPGTSPKG